MTDEMKQMARQYHALGFNIVPLGADKRPVKTGVADNGKIWRFRWEDWQTVRQSSADLNQILRNKWWIDVRGIAAVCGFGGACCLDMDSRHKNDPSIPPIPRTVADAWLEELMLPVTYPWLVSTPTGGWHIWANCDAIASDKGKLDRLYPDDETVDHVELRWFGHYTALPGTSHPSGGTYAFAN